MCSPLAVFAFVVVTDRSKWEYTIYHLPVGLWSPDTVCTEEKGNPAITCVKSDSPSGANCTPRHYLIGKRTSYISGSMTSFVLPGPLPSGECFLLSRPFLVAVVSVFLFLVDLRKVIFFRLSVKMHGCRLGGCEISKWVQGSLGSALGSLVKKLFCKWGGSTHKTASPCCEVNSS